MHSNKLWEYPNAGIPILAISLVEIKAMLDKYGTGYLLPRNLIPMTFWTICAVTDEDLGNKVNNCANFSLEESWESYEPRLLALYDNFMN